MGISPLTAKKIVSVLSSGTLQPPNPFTQSPNVLSAYHVPRTVSPLPNRSDSKPSDKGILPAMVLPGEGPGP